MAESFSIIETLRDFVHKAELIGVDYMVTGSFAMSAYGEIRFTRDIDIVVQLSETQAAKIAQAFSTDYYISENSIRHAIQHRSMFNIIRQPYGEKIDCILQKDTEFGRASFDRRRIAKIGDVEFWVSTKEDLIIAKLDWARDSRSEMQIRDVAGLTSAGYNEEYLLTWIDRLGLADVWEDVKSWKTRPGT